MSTAAAIIFDINGNPIAVSGGMVLPQGTLGQLAAAVDSNGFVRYLSTVSGSLMVTGSMTANVAFPSELNVANFPAVQAVSGTVSVGNWPATIGVSSSFPMHTWDGGIQGVSASVPFQVWNEGTVGISGTVTLGSQVSVNNFPATQNVSGTVGAIVDNWPATFGISGTVGVNNFPAVQAVSGTVTSIIGNWPATIGVSASVPIQIWSAGPIGVTGTLTVTEGVTQTAQNVSSSAGMRVFNTDPVGVSGTVSIGNWPSTIGISASVPLQVWSEGSIGVTGSVSLTSQISVNNFPATQNISGTVGSVIQNWPSTIGVSASVPLQVWSAGPIGVTGTLTVTEGVTQTAQNVSSSAGLRIFNTDPVGISASVPLQVWTAGTIGISGTVSLGSQVSVNNFPATQNVSGSVGAYIQNWPAVFGVSGSLTVTEGVTQTAQNVSSSSGLRVFNTDPVGVSGTVSIGNWPATIGISASVPVQVWNASSVGISGTVTLGSQVSVNNFPATQNVSGTVGTIIQNWPATIGVSASNPLQVWSQGSIGVTGSVSITSQISVNNFPNTQNVSGTVGAVIQNWPALIGVSGTVTTTQGVTQTAQNVSSSAGLRVFNDAPVGISASVPLQVWSQGSIGITGSVSLAGQVSVNNFPATQAISGTVASYIQNWPATIGVSASVPFQVWNQATVGISGTVTIGSQVSVNNFPATQNVSGTVGSVIQNWPSIIGVSASVPLQVWNPALVGVSGTVSLASQISVNNFPATQAVSGTVANYIQNWPAVLGVSASVPMQVWNAGTVGVSGSLTITQGVTQTAQNVSSSAGVRVFNTDPVGISASVPLQVWQTGPVGISASVPIQIWSAGTIGVSGTFTSVQGVTQTAQNVSSSAGLRVFNTDPVGISASVPIQIWSAGTIGVSGTFTATQGVTQTAQNVSSSAGVRVFNTDNVGISGSVGISSWQNGVTASVAVTNLQQVSIQTPLSIINYDLNTNVYSSSYTFLNDSTLAQLELKFSAAQPRTISASLSNGELLFAETNSNYHVQLDFENYAIDAGTSIFLYITQSLPGGACTLNGDLTMNTISGPFNGVTNYTVTNPLMVALGDGAHLDAFSRVRMAQPESLFYSIQRYGDNKTDWETQRTGTGADITFLPNEGTIQMTTGAVTSGNKVIRSTLRSFRYEPGKSLLILMTFVFDGGAVANLQRRVGYFNSANGIFLELAGSTLRFVRRTSVSGSPVDNQVAQSSWNIDKFDGTGRSGITLDISKCHIVVIDLQFLGVGRIRVGFDIDGVIYYAHQFLNANVLTTVYMTTAHLNCRLEIENTGTTVGINTLRHICTAVISEGGNERTLGKNLVADSGTALTAVSSATPVPIVSIRPAVTSSTGIANEHGAWVENWQIANTGNNTLYWQVVLNATLTGPNWKPVNLVNSIAQYDVSATAISGGIIIDSGMAPASAQAKNATSAGALSDLALHYSNLLGTQNTLSIAVSVPGSNTTAWAALNWIEKW